MLPAGFHPNLFDHGHANRSRRRIYNRSGTLSAEGAVWMRQEGTGMTSRLPLLASLLLGLGISRMACAEVDLPAWDLNGDGTLDMKEVRENRGAYFDRYDDDGNEFLDVVEFIELCEAPETVEIPALDDVQADTSKGQLLGKEPNFTILQRKANRITDRDRDGLITRDEFVAASSFWLKRYDENGDGILTPADF
jgi:hypothetical protein